MEYICKFCGKKYLDRNQIGGHTIGCKKNPNKQNNFLSSLGHKHTRKIKKLLSIQRKDFLAKNKHNWAIYKGKESDPEKKFRALLDEFNIKYFQEYTPNNSQRFYRIDFAILEKQIGFEINGNQHYTKNGCLKRYYNIRQKYLESLGWAIINIHYSIVYNKPKVLEILQKHTLVIQRTEILPSKQKVVGSTPTESTILS